MIGNTLHGTDPIRPARFVRFGDVLVVFVSSLLILTWYGCRSMTIGNFYVDPVEGSSVMPLTMDEGLQWFDNGSIAQEIGSGQFVTMSRPSGDSVALTCWNDTLGQIWRTAFATPDRGSSTHDESWHISRCGENPFSILRRGGSLNMLSTRNYDEHDDSLLAITRSIDPASGRITEPVVLAATRIKGYLPRVYRRWFFLIAPDSNIVLCISPDNDGDERQNVAKIVAVGYDGTQLASREIPIGDLNALDEFRIDHQGDLFQITRVAPDTIRVRLFGICTQRLDTTLMLHLDFPGAGDAAITDYIATFVGANNLALFTVHSSAHTFEGMRWTKIRTSTFEHSSRTLSINREATKQLHNGENLTNVYFRSLYVSTKIDSRYFIVLAAQRINRYAPDFPITMALLDHESLEQWCKLYEPRRSRPFAFSPIVNDTLRTLWVNADTLVLDKHLVTDGKRLPGYPVPVAYAPDISGLYYRDFIWLNSHAVILFARTSGTFRPRWHICRFEAHKTISR